MTSRRALPIIFSIFFAIAAGVALRYLFSSKVDELPIPKSGYFGPGNPKPDDLSVQPFQVNFSMADVAELKQRLQSARVGHDELEDVQDWSYGIRLSILREWRDYWATKFDFALAQAELNRFPQFTTQIEGLSIHFLHVKPPRPEAYRRAVPLLLAHGWPGGVYEFYQMIPMLTDPKAHQMDSEVAFEVVIPGIPGYGFSEAPHRKGLDGLATARIFHRLMTERLNLTKYMAQGGDWGALIVSNLGRFYPNEVVAIHLNMVFAHAFQSLRHFLIALLGAYRPNWVFSEPEHFQHFSPRAQMMELVQETGYMHIQSTKPDTVGVALNDSPFGLLAYILEKFSTWTNPGFRSLPDGGVLDKYTYDQVLTLISVYWLQGNILSSQRFYKENAAVIGGGDPYTARFVSVPTGYAAFGHDLGGPQPRELVKLSYNLKHMTVFPDGGHFAALEQPTALATDVLRFANRQLLGL